MGATKTVKSHVPQVWLDLGGEIDWNSMTPQQRETLINILRDLASNPLVTMKLGFSIPMMK